MRFFLGLLFVIGFFAACAGRYAPPIPQPTCNPADFGCLDQPCQMGDPYCNDMTKKPKLKHTEVVKPCEDKPVSFSGQSHYWP